ncbi:MAG: Tfp pilus assembly protein FimT/FimU [Candidatus Nanohalobium sp.]
MDKLIELIIVVMVLTITGAIVMFGFSDHIHTFDKSGDQILNGTGCKYARQQKDKGAIDELPDKCKTDFRPEPPRISAT